MKFTFGMFLIVISFAACKKQALSPEVGDTCIIKSDIFSKGSFQPTQPVKIDRIYIDPSSGYLYCQVNDANNVTWYLPKDDLLVEAN